MGVLSSAKPTIIPCNARPTARSLNALVYKVRDALAAGASNMAAAASGGRGAPPGGIDRPGAAAAATAAVLLKTTVDEAVLTVKEAVKGGSSSVLLATVTLPVVQKVSICRQQNGLNHHSVHDGTCLGAPVDRCWPT